MGVGAVNARVRAAPLTLASHLPFLNTLTTPPPCAHTSDCPQAIQWAWELSTRVYGLNPERVWVSVYEEDDEAARLWAEVVGVPPERIKRMGAADNFWASGATGAGAGMVCGCALLGGYMSEPVGGRSKESMQCSRRMMSSARVSKAGRGAGGGGGTQPQWGGGVSPAHCDDARASVFPTSPPASTPTLPSPLLPHTHPRPLRPLQRAVL